MVSISFGVCSGSCWGLTVRVTPLVDHAVYVLPCAGPALGVLEFDCKSDSFG